jgi:hypothetical protein
MFLPSNAFSVTDRLVLSIDSLTVPEPGGGAGRHFVARGLQRRCQSVGEAVGFLRANPSASGYAYTIGSHRAVPGSRPGGRAGGDGHQDGAGADGTAADGTVADGTAAGRVVAVEAVRDQQHVTEVGGPEGLLFWHTNHGRFVPGTVGADVCERAGVLAGAPPPDGEPDAGWFLRLLAGAPVPDGVRADPTAEHPFLTLCTFVADLTGGEAVIQWRGERPVSIPLLDLPAGRQDAACVLPGPVFQAP